MFKRIIWTTDFSENSLASLGYAEELASRFDAELLVVHVLLDIPFFYVPFLGESSAYMSELDETRQETQSELEKIVDRLIKRGVAAKTMLLEGSPYAEIVKFAEAEKADLIVMSTRGLSGIERFIVGSTAEKVVRKAPCPVLTVHDAPPIPLAIKDIVMLTDLSGLSAKALPYVQAIAEAFGARVRALHVIEADVPLNEDEEKLLTNAIRDAMAEILDEDTQGDFIKRVEEVVIKDKSAIKGVEKYLRENPGDLLVMSTHGRTGLSRVLMGSVAEKVLRSVRLPILTVRARP